MRVGLIMAGLEMRRATGALTVRSGEEECRLYFMLGHVYHAEAPGEVEGQAAVDIATGWSDFQYSFDPDAKLPTRETIGDEAVEGQANNAKREEEDLRARAVYFFTFLVIAAALMIYFFSQRN